MQQEKGSFLGLFSQFIIMFWYTIRQLRYLLSLVEICNYSLDDLNDTLISYGAQVAKLVAFSSNDLAHDTTHDLQWN